MRLSHLAIAGSVVLASVSVASAAIMDSEPNNTPATASPIGYIPGGTNFADVGVAGFTANDVDFYSLPLNVGDFLTVTTFPTQINFLQPDTILALIDPSGTIVSFNDDTLGTSGSDGSTIVHQATVAGNYSLAVSGFGDFIDAIVGSTNVAAIDGNHNETGSYILTVSVVPVVPEPVTLGLAGGLGLLALRRKH